MAQKKQKSPELNLRLFPVQGKAFKSTANEILYGGAAGGGKSHLIRVMAIFLAWCVPGIQIYIFRRLSDDLVRNHMEGAGGFYALLEEALASGAVTFNGSRNFLRFKNGSKIWLCHCQYEKDVRKYQGAEFHALFLDELTHFTDKQYRFLRSRCRLGTLKVPQSLKAKLPLILCGSNPGSVGHAWVKNTFLDGGMPYEIRQMPSKEGGMRRQFIPARLQDNPALDQEQYRDILSGLGSPELVAAMLNGDWDAMADGALSDVWDRSTVLLPRFRIPSSWRLSRAMDWGSSHPFSVGWYAEADGTEAQLPEGRVFCPPKGSLVRYWEYYGCKSSADLNVGLRISARDVAKGIKEAEVSMRKGQWVHRDSKVAPGPADNEIYNVKEKESGSIARLMAKEGVLWCRSDKASGSRRNGLQMLREYLTASSRGEGPGLYFTSNCVYAQKTLPVIARDPKDPDDVDTSDIDHIYDEVRYRVLHQKKRMAHQTPVSFPS